MTSIANISINDGKSTPVAHVFAPMSTNPATLRNGASEASSQGIVYDELLSIDVKLNPTGISKALVQLKLPHDSTALSNDGAVVFETAKVEFLFPPTASAANRKDARVLMMNALQNAIVIDAIDNLNAPY